jgi:SAM-dependent methyltransferase
MSVLDKQAKPVQPDPADAPPVFFDARAEFAVCFLSGQGLEIGALHLPLATPPHAEVRYVDRMPVESLRAEYPELAGWNLTPVDVIDNGELLSTIPESSQDFIVANHFLEHCEDPIRTIGTHLSKLKPGGVLFYAVPDKRYTFDFQRPVTPLDHMIDDHERGPERSRRDHYDQWARLVVVSETESPEETTGRARDLEAAEYSIHMHVWTQAEFLRLLLHCRERFEEAFDIEAAARQAIEFVVVLRKAGGSPRPVAPPAAIGGGQPWRRLPHRAIAKIRTASRRRAQR